MMTVHCTIFTKYLSAFMNGRVWVSSSNITIYICCFANSNSSTYMGLAFCGTSFLNLCRRVSKFLSPGRTRDGTELRHFWFYEDPGPYSVPAATRPLKWEEWCNPIILYFNFCLFTRNVSCSVSLLMGRKPKICIFFFI